MVNAHYSSGDLDVGLACVLQQAFGRVPQVDLIPVPSGTSGRRRAFALHGPDLPPAVLLLRYPHEEMYGALRTFHALQALREVIFHAAPQVFYMGWGHFGDEVLLLLEYTFGRSVEGHPAAFFARVGNDFAVTLARLHQIPWPAMPELPRFSFMDALRELGARVQVLGVPPLRELFQRLWAWAPEIWERPYCLVHGRYTLESVVSLQTRVVAVYGWERAALADARLDFGYACASLSAHRPQMAETFAAAYMRQVGPVQDARFWNALGGLRVLVELTEKLHAALAPQDAPLRYELGEQWRNVYAFASAQAGIALP